MGYGKYNEKKGRAFSIIKMKKIKKVREIRKIDYSTFVWISKCILLEGYAEKIGAHGLAVYTVLATCANNNQECYPSEAYIAEILNCSRNTVRKYLKRLAKQKIIKVKSRTRHRSTYQLLHIKCPTGKHLRNKKGVADVQNLSTNENNEREYEENETTLINKKEIESMPKMQKEPPENIYHKLIQENILALRLAESLNDAKSLPFYQSVAQKYSESVLIEILDHVNEMPERKIKKSRAHLFNYLITQHGKKAN